MNPFKTTSALIILILFIFYTQPGWSQDESSASGDKAESAQTVRVAFFPMPGFHQTHPVTGEPAGYDVDYLNRLSQHTRWKIHYLPVSTWDDALQALENGDVDLVSSAQVNRARLDRFAYSADAAGRTRAAMVTLRSNKNLVFEDFAAFDKLRVGVVKTWIRRTDFLEYAQLRGFRPDVREFDSTAQMREALHANAIDAMVMNIMEAEPAYEKRLAEFLPAPFFYIMRKDNAVLKMELDEALSRLRLGTPGLDTFLMKKWYPSINKTPYSKAELDYAQSNPDMTMSLLVNRPPFSQLREGELRFEGIVPAVLNLLSKDSGIRFVLSPLAQEGSPIELVAEGKVRAVAGVARFDAQLSDPRVVVTDPFFTSSLVLVGPTARLFLPEQPSIVAVPKGFWGGKNYILRTFPNFTVLEVAGNGRACLEAVRSGRADYALVNSLGVGPQLHSPRYAGIDVVPGVSAVEQLALLLPSDADPLLLSILNKSIRRLNDGDLHRITADYSLSNAYRPTLHDFFLQYRTPILIAFPLLLLGLVLFVLYIMQQARARRLAKKTASTINSIVTTLNAGIITLNPAADCVITYANSGFWSLVGLPPKNSLDADTHLFWPFLHADDVEPFASAMRESAQHGTPIRIALRLHHSSGELSSVLLRGTTRVDARGVAVVYCVLLD